MLLFGIVSLSLLASYLVGCFLDPIAAFFCLWFSHFPVSKRLGNLFVQFEFCFGSSLQSGFVQGHIVGLA